MLLEKESINNETINNFLSNYLKKYIKKLTFKNHELTLEINNTGNEYLESLLNLMENFNPIFLADTISENDLVELRLELNMDGDNIERLKIAESVFQLFIVTRLLKIQPFIKETFTHSIFLSHSSWDAREVMGLKLILEEKYNKSAYVDWIDDKQANFPRAISKILDTIKSIADKRSYEVIEKVYSQAQVQIIESNISNLILNKMSLSKSLFYVQSMHYDHSRWMPYELGLAESSGKLIFRLPIKYIKIRKKYGKRSSFLTKYDSIVDQNEKFKYNYLRLI